MKRNVNYDWKIPIGEGCYKVAIRGREGIVDDNDRIIIPIMFDSVSRFDENDHTVVYYYGSCGLMNRQGQKVGETMFRSVARFGDEDVTRVQFKCGKYGFMDKNGKVVSKERYEDATEFENGYATVVLKGRKFVIDYECNEVKG